MSSSGFGESFRLGRRAWKEVEPLVNSSLGIRCGVVVSDIFIFAQAGIYIPFCFLNESQLSFSAAKTRAAIILTSVEASCGNCTSLAHLASKKS